MGEARSSIKVELLSAYGATIARIGAWVVVSGLVFRRAGMESFAMFALVRTTLGILSYCSFGSLPAMVGVLTRARRKNETEIINAAVIAETGIPPVLEYEGERNSPAKPYLTDEQRIFLSGGMVSLITFAVGGLLLIGYSFGYREIHTVPNWMKIWLVQDLIMGIGFGLLLRIMSDPFSGILQARGHIVWDNVLFVTAETLWALLVFADQSDVLTQAARWYYLTGGLLLFARMTFALVLVGRIRVWLMDRSAFRELVVSGLAITLAQLADFLYAPTDNLLINRLLDHSLVGVYAPAIQIDAGLIMLMTGVSAVILPRAADAHHSGDRQKVREYYIKGTLMSTGVLVVAALGAWILSPWIFKAWFNDPMTATQAILPLVLIHTVLGGSSAVGRSVLIGMGKVKAFTIAVLVSGAANVLMSFCLVYYGKMGLKGIILGTILAVVGRCGVWMPWYVLRELKKG